MRRRLKSDAFDDAIDVIIDTPAGAAKSQQESTSTSLLNLFFYRIEPSQFYADAGARDRWYVRVLCLITAFSTTETIDDPDTHSTTVIPQGEVDLMVLGEVLRYFHENPILKPVTPEEDVGAYLQVVLTTLSSQEINQIWSTQGEVAYRPSLLYEIALLPIEPKKRAAPPLPVVAGGIDLQTHAKMTAARRKPPPPPWISPRLESGEGPDWVPALSFVTGGIATQYMSIAAGANLKVPVWIAGRPGATVHLVWERIDRGVWQPVSEAGGAVDATVPAQPSPPGDGVIEPAAASAALTVDMPVPAVAPVQLLLHAERTGAGGAVLKSNPLILTVTQP